MTEVSEDNGCLCRPDHNGIYLWTFQIGDDANGVAKIGSIDVGRWGPSQPQYRRPENINDRSIQPRGNWIDKERKREEE